MWISCHSSDIVVCMALPTEICLFNMDKLGTDKHGHCTTLLLTLMQAAANFWSAFTSWAVQTQASRIFTKKEIRHKSGHNDVNWCLLLMLICLLRNIKGVAHHTQNPQHQQVTVFEGSDISKTIWWYSTLQILNPSLRLKIICQKEPNWTVLLSLYGYSQYNGPGSGFIWQSWRKENLRHILFKASKSDT